MWTSKSIAAKDANDDLVFCFFLFTHAFLAGSPIYSSAIHKEVVYINIQLLCELLRLLYVRNWHVITWCKLHSIFFLINVVFLMSNEKDRIKLIACEDQIRTLPFSCNKQKLHTTILVFLGDYTKILLWNN